MESNTTQPALSVYDCLWAYARLNHCEAAFEEEFASGVLNEIIHRDFPAGWFEYSSYITQQELQSVFDGPHLLFRLIRLVMFKEGNFILHGWWNSDEELFYAYMTNSEHVRTIYISPRNILSNSWDREE